MKTNSINTLTLVMIALIMSGCGGKGPSEELQATEPGKDQLASATSKSFISSTPNVQASSTPETSNLAPVYKFQVEAVGYNSVTYTVRARNTVKIKFTPGIQNKSIQLENTTSNFYPQYSALGVYIKVGSLEQPTPLLKNGYDGKEAESSQVLNFSSSFTKTCSQLDPLCRETVTITVNKPNNDYWCLNFGSYCTHTHVWDTHPWNGVLSVQTDDTEAL